MLSYWNSKIKMTGKKYGYKSASFDMLAGHTCPMANICHSKVVEDKKGKRHIVDEGQFRCYAVKAEVAYTTVYKHRKANIEKSQSESFVDDMIQEIQDNKVTLIRIHTAGDFYNWQYFQKWITIIKALPEVTFFAYTKQASFVKWYLEHELPNFKMTYSMGGLMDKYAIEHGLPHCTVIVDGYNPENLPITCTHEDKVNDFEYIMRGESFGIAFH